VAIDDDLVKFVRDALARGVARAEIEQALRQAGWKPEQVNSALGSFAAVEFPIPVPRPRPSLFAREAFVYLLLFTTLYIVAFNLGSLLFRFINRLFPDPASRQAETFREGIRFSVSALIVGLPVFLYISRLANRSVAQDPSQRASPVRRWLTYLTLFLAACVLIGDFTGLVYNLLGGELTVRFVLKVLTVGAISGTLFWYYLSDLRSDEKSLAA
jgi:hypothetical protein